MEEVRDCNGSLVCIANGSTGLVERKTSKEHVTALLPVGGKIAFDTKGAYNKIFAKLGSDYKKPDAITEFSRENYKEKVWPLPASDMIYVGPATEAKLAKYGIRTIGQLADTPPGLLKDWFGVNGLALWRYANGTDQSRVMQKDFVSPVKSIGHSITCTADLENEEEVYKVMFELSQDVGHRLRLHGLAARGVQIWIRTNELSGMQCQCKLPFRSQSPTEITAAGFSLFKERYRWNQKVRAVCIRATDLVPVSVGSFRP